MGSEPRGPVCTEVVLAVLSVRLCALVRSVLGGERRQGRLLCSCLRAECGRVTWRQRRYCLTTSCYSVIITWIFDTPTSYLPALLRAVFITSPGLRFFSSPVTALGNPRQVLTICVGEEVIEPEWLWVILFKNTQSVGLKDCDPMFGILAVGPCFLWYYSFLKFYFLSFLFFKFFYFLFWDKFLPIKKITRKVELSCVPCTQIYFFFFLTFFNMLPC